MGRSRGTRPAGAGTRAGATPASSAAGTRAGTTPASSAPSLDPLLQPRVWQSVVYRPLDQVEWDKARALFTYAALWVAPASPGELGWGAWNSEQLVGAIVLEPHGANGMVYGPVVVNQPDPFEVASQLLAATLPHATALSIGTLFTRPQGLERLWVRFGFIPVPEAELPKALKGRPGIGLFAWRGGSALWTSVGAGPRAGAAPASSAAGPRVSATPAS